MVPGTRMRHTRSHTHAHAHTLPPTPTGTEVLRLPMPLVVTADLRLNEPRYAKLPNIMKAKKKPLEAIDAASLGIDLSPRYTIVEVNDPPVRAAGIVVDSVDSLVDKLANEAKVEGFQS